MLQGYRCDWTLHGGSIEFALAPLFKGLERMDFVEGTLAFF